MQYNCAKLTQELINAGIPIHGCASDGRIDFKDEVTEAQKAQAETIKANHNPVWWLEERRKAWPPVGDQLDGHFKGFKTLLAFLKSKFPEATDQEILDGCIEQVVTPCQAVKDKFPKN